MTMKVKDKYEEHKFSAKRKTHPNASRYPCRGTHEVLQAGMKLLGTLSADERKKLQEGQLVIDEEETEELFDSFQENDIIGLGLICDEGFRANTYRIDKVKPDGEDYLLCENALSGEMEEISFEDVSAGLAMGFAEILYRDDKPYGISDEMEYTVRVYKEDDDEQSESETQEGEDGASADSSKQTEESNTEQTNEQDNASSDTGAGESASSTEVDSLRQVSGWSDFYFSFGKTKQPSGELVPWVVITPKALWDEAGQVDDQNTAKSYTAILNLQPVENSIFLYDSVWNQAFLRQKLERLGAEENTEIADEVVRLYKEAKEKQEQEQQQQEAEEEASNTEEQNDAENSAANTAEAG